MTIMWSLNRMSHGYRFRGKSDTLNSTVTTWHYEPRCKRYQSTLDAWSLIRSRGNAKCNLGERSSFLSAKRGRGQMRAISGQGWVRRPSLTFERLRKKVK